MTDIPIDSIGEVVTAELAALAAFRGWLELHDEQIAMLTEIVRQLQRQIDIVTGARMGG